MVETEQENPIFLKGERNITYPVEGNSDCQGYLVKNDSKWGLVVISEWWGLNKSICKSADFIASKGFQTIVPDTYRGENAIDREHAGHLMGGLDFKRAVEDIIAGSKYLKANGCEKVGVIGFCMGGALSLAAASVSTEFDVALPYYGIPDQTYFPVKNIKCPVYLQVGSLDDLKGFSDPETCLNIQKVAKEAGVNFEIKIWEGAKHAFMNQDSEKFNLEVAKQSINETTEYVKKLFS